MTYAGDARPPGDPWGDQRKLLDDLAAASSGKHRALIVFRATWPRLVVRLTGRVFTRVAVGAVLTFGLLGLLVGGVLHLLGGPGSLARDGLAIGAVVGLAIALIALVQGAWLRRRLSRSLR